MTLTYILIILLALAGGFIGSLMSGGSLITLFILTLLSIPTTRAIGTLKLVITALTLVSSLTYLKEKAVDIRLAPTLIVSSILGSFLGSTFLMRIPEETARIVVTVFILIGVYFVIRGGRQPREPMLRSRILQGLIGLGAGFYIGVLGIASTLMIISILYLFFSLDMLKANGTAKAIIFFNNLIAFANYASQGSVDYTIAALMTPPIMIGSWLGAKTAISLGSERLKIVFVIIAIITAIRILFQVF